MKISKILEFFKKKDLVNKSVEMLKDPQYFGDQAKAIFEANLLTNNLVDNFTLENDVYSINTQATFNSELYEFFEPSSNFKIKLEDILNIESNKEFKFFQFFKLKENSLEEFGKIHTHLREYNYVSYHEGNLTSFYIKSIEGDTLKIEYCFVFENRYYGPPQVLNPVVKLLTITDNLNLMISNYHNILNAKINYSFLVAKYNYNIFEVNSQIEKNWDEICDFLLDIQDMSFNSYFNKDSKKVTFEIDGIHPLEQKVTYHIPYGKSYGSTKETSIGTSNIRLTKEFLKLMNLCSEFLNRMNSTFDDVNVDILIDKNKVTFIFTH